MNYQNEIYCIPPKCIKEPINELFTVQFLDTQLRDSAHFRELYDLADVLLKLNIVPFRVAGLGAFFSSINLKGRVLQNLYKINLPNLMQTFPTFHPQLHTALKEWITQTSTTPQTLNPLEQLYEKNKSLILFRGSSILEKKRIFKKIF